MTRTCTTAQVIKAATEAASLIKGNADDFVTLVKQQEECIGNLTDRLVTAATTITDLKRDLASTTADATGVRHAHARTQSALCTERTAHSKTRDEFRTEVFANDRATNMYKAQVSALQEEVVKAYENQTATVSPYFDVAADANPMMCTYRISIRPKHLCIEIADRALAECDDTMLRRKAEALANAARDDLADRTYEAYLQARGPMKGHYGFSHYAIGTKADRVGATEAYRSRPSYRAWGGPLRHDPNY